MRKFWCDTCEDETEQVDGYCTECGTDMLWGSTPLRKNLCAWCYVYEREQGSTFCVACNGDMDREDERWIAHDVVVEVAVEIPPVEEELERIPCRTRR